jgi:hypothetical protein
MLSFIVGHVDTHCLISSSTKVFRLIEQVEYCGPVVEVQLLYEASSFQEAHMSHTDAPGPLKAPLAHALHLPAPAPLKVPLGHIVQLACPI